MTRDERQFEARRRALDAIASMRHDGRTLTAAAAESGTTATTVRRYAAAALNRQGRSYAVTKSDRLARHMSVFTADGVRVVTVRGSNKARQVAQHWNAIQKFQKGDLDALKRFEGKSVAGVALATDNATISAYSHIGESPTDDIYAIPT